MKTLVFVLALGLLTGIVDLYGAIKNVLWWRPARNNTHEKEAISVKCRTSNCYITKNRTYLPSVAFFDAILFDGGDMFDGGLDLPKDRSKRQKYVFSVREPVPQSPTCDSTYDGFFNWTWTYRLDSDIVWRYLEIYNYAGHVVGPKANMHWDAIKPMKEFDLELTSKFNSKHKAAATIISRCYSHSHRDVFVTLALLKYELKQYGFIVDVFGECGDMTCEDCATIFQVQYYFYLAFEDFIVEDYVSGNALMALNHFVIPVMFGGADYSRFLPPGSYINGKELGPKALAKEMANIIYDPPKYRSFFLWVLRYRYVMATLEENMCIFCDFLDDDDKRNAVSTYDDFNSWWNINGNCSKVKAKFNATEISTTTTKKSIMSTDKPVTQNEKSNITLSEASDIVTENLNIKTETPDIFVQALVKILSPLEILDITTENPNITMETTDIYIKTLAQIVSPLEATDINREKPALETETLYTRSEKLFNRTETSKILIERQKNASTSKPDMSDITNERQKDMRIDKPVMNTENTIMNTEKPILNSENQNMKTETLYSSNEKQTITTEITDIFIPRHKVTTTEKPVMNIEEPDMRTETIYASTENPVITKESSDIFIKRRKSLRIENSVITTETVCTSTEKPVITTETLHTSTEKPVITTETLHTSTEKSVITTEKLDTSTEKPVITTEKLHTSTEKSIISTETLYTSTEQPVITTETLHTSTKKPVITTETSADISIKRQEKTRTEKPNLMKENDVMRTETIYNSTEKPVITTVTSDISIKRQKDTRKEKSATNTNIPNMITEKLVVTTETLNTTTKEPVITTGKFDIFVKRH